MPAPAAISPDILVHGIRGEDIPRLEQWGEYLAKKDDKIKLEDMSGSQIRKFFGEIKRIQSDFEKNKSNIVLLEPKIAYAVGRAKKGANGKNFAIEDFYKLLKPLLRDINGDKKKFKHFVQVFEAIVAYHKAKGGKD